MTRQRDQALGPWSLSWSLSHVSLEAITRREEAMTRREKTGLKPAEGPRLGVNDIDVVNIETCMKVMLAGWGPGRTRRGL